MPCDTNVNADKMLGLLATAALAPFAAQLLRKRESTRKKRRGPRRIGPGGLIYKKGGVVKKRGSKKGGKR